MNKLSVLAVGVCAAGLIGAAPAAKAPPPVASYWMDVATQSGMGAGMTRGGSRPSMDQIMGMMSGRSSVVHSLDLRLASKTKATAAPKADHWIPAGLQMGESLPLVAPVREAPQPGPNELPRDFQRPKGRMLIYYGCGEHAAAPTVLDFAKLAAGQVPPEMAAMGRMQAHVRSGPTSAPGFGEWPNLQDSRTVPAAGSLIGTHKVEANYAPPIAFNLASGQDFMPALGLTEAGALPSGAVRLRWNLAPSATGYALAMFGANGSGDMIMWSSGKAGAFPTLDYLAPSEVKRMIGLGGVLPPTTSECLLPAEVAAAVPAGMVMGIGYGPEVNFAETPKAPKWVAKVRYKTTASLMRGMGAMMGGTAQGEEPQQQQKQPKKKRFGIGDLLGGAVPH